MVRSLPRKTIEIARIGFILEIVDFTQYERTIEAIRKVDGVLDVIRLQDEEAISGDMVVLRRALEGK